jgi:hypothetical protein
MHGAAHAESQEVRKRIKEIFGWTKRGASARAATAASSAHTRRANTSRRPRRNRRAKAQRESVVGTKITNPQNRAVFQQPARSLPLGAEVGITLGGGGFRQLGGADRFAADGAAPAFATSNGEYSVRHFLSVWQSGGCATLIALPFSKSRIDRIYLGT